MTAISQPPHVEIHGQYVIIDRVQKSFEVLCRHVMETRLSVAF